MGLRKEDLWGLAVEAFLENPEDLHRTFPSLFFGVLFSGKLPWKLDEGLQIVGTYIRRE